MHLRGVQPDAEGVGVAGEERVGGTHLRAVDEGRDDGGTAALADVVSGEAVGTLGGAGVEAAEDAVGGRGELDVARLDDQRAAHLDLVDGGEGGLAVEAVASGKDEARAAEGEMRAGIGDVPGLRVEGRLVKTVTEKSGLPMRNGLSESVNRVVVPSPAKSPRRRRWARSHR